MLIDCSDSNLELEVAVTLIFLWSEDLGSPVRPVLGSLLQRGVQLGPRTELVHLVSALTARARLGGVPVQVLLDLAQLTVELAEDLVSPALVVFLDPNNFLVGRGLVRPRLGRSFSLYLGVEVTLEPGPPLITAGDHAGQHVPRVTAQLARAQSGQFQG